MIGPPAVPASDQLMGLGILYGVPYRTYIDQPLDLDLACTRNLALMSIDWQLASNSKPRSDSLVLSCVAASWSDRLHSDTDDRLLLKEALKRRSLERRRQSHRAMLQAIVPWLAGRIQQVSDWNVDVCHS